MFVLVVFVASLRNGLLHLTNNTALFANNRFAFAFRRYISEAPLFRSRHAVVYKVLGTSFFTMQAPLRGETLLLVALFIANLVPMVAFYSPYTSNNLYWPDEEFLEIGRYLSDRAGIMAIAQLPILILLSGRSNPVTFLTGASFATCMLYHRWVARLFAVQVFVHVM
jgi:hypothetical protein